jgi:hypothetical protein
VVSRPRLFGRLAAQARVTVVSAPPGSGKTVLLRSWISQAGLAGRAAWVPAERGESDPQRFWPSVLGALRQAAPGSALVRPLTAAPDLDGWAITERLLTDLAPLAERLWLVIDDVHELGPQALSQLELLVMRAPPALRFVLATRHDVQLGLHRLRLEGELAEIRADDLRFTLAEARELFAAAGVQLPEPAAGLLQERTEGWAAGLRLAALSLAGHPDPARFAAGFSGTERTVAEYLLAEVLDRQSEPVRRLLLRTSILDRVNGELADLLTGDEVGERVLQDLEQANAFVVSLDPARSWFRYHQLFAGLLALELRRTALGRSPHCTVPRRSGSRRTSTRWRRSGTPRPPRTGGWPPGCSPTTGPACTWTGRPQSSTSCSPGSRPVSAWPMPGWPRWPRRMSWRTGRWMWPKGTWGWRSGARRRCRTAGASKYSCCSGSSGCCWPASVATCRPSPRRHSSCNRRPRPWTLRRPPWARTSAR